MDSSDFVKDQVERLTAVSLSIEEKFLHDLESSALVAELKRRNELHRARQAAKTVIEDQLDAR